MIIVLIMMMMIRISMIDNYDNENDDDDGADGDDGRNDGGDVDANLIASAVIDVTMIIITTIITMMRISCESRSPDKNFECIRREVS